MVDEWGHRAGMSVTVRLLDCLRETRPLSVTTGWKWRQRLIGGFSVCPLLLLN